jgi:hypothetical protein
MSNTLLINTIFVFFTSYSVRFWVNRYRAINSDSYGHILFAKSLNPKKYFNFFGPIKLNIVGSTNLLNPYLWNKLISFIPVKHLINYNKYFNILLDSIFISLIFIALVKLDILSENRSLIACLIYSLSLINFSNISIGPRVSAFTPRVFSEILVNIFCIMFVLNIDSFSTHIYISLTILSYLILISSKFGTQFIILFSILFSCLNLSYVLLIPITGGLFLCLVIHNKYFIKYLFYYYNFQKNYITNVLNKKTFTHKRNNLECIIKFFKSQLHINHLIVWNTFIALFYKFPYIFCIFPYFFVLDKNIFCFLISVLILFVLTSLKWFLSFGEAERYISHSSVSILIVTIQYIPTTLIIGLLFIIIIFIIHEFRYINKIQPNYNEFYKFLNSIKPSIICLFPLYAAGGHWRILLETKHKVLTPIPGGCNSTLLNTLNNEYLTCNPYYDLNKIDDLSKNYGVNIFIIFKPDLKLANQSDFTVPKNWKVLNYDDPNFLILQR